MLARAEAWRKANPEKRKAQTAVQRAVKRGTLVRPEACACGNPKVEGHHADYSKPLEVEWLCRRCHKRKHRRL